MQMTAEELVHGFFVLGFIPRESCIELLLASSFATGSACGFDVSAIIHLVGRFDCSLGENGNESRHDGSLFLCPCCMDVWEGLSDDQRGNHP